jgi:hypothetical protein
MARHAEDDPAGAGYTELISLSEGRHCDRVLRRSQRVDGKWDGAALRGGRRFEQKIAKIAKICWDAGWGGVERGWEF